ncbi:MAG: DUF1998 domain-containing protein [Bacteroidetes bacterium]|nr:DUF1998 domain-containing protein [Bacteroidota bacterium]
MQYEPIQNRKLISAYGGIGSIIETRQGAVKIEEFNNWPFFLTNQHFDINNHISDFRFLSRLRTYFTKLKELVRLPENQLNQGFAPESNKDLVSAIYFPKWMYCTSCHSFDHYDQWKQNWDNTVKEIHKDDFHPPKCYRCYDDKKKKGSFYELEQVRFIMTSPSGNIADVPWSHWVLRNSLMKNFDNHQINPSTTEEGESDSNQISLNLYEIQIPDNLELKYRISSRFGDLKGIRIEAYQYGKQIASTTLSKIFNLRIWESQHPEIHSGNSQLKTVIRSSNSVYYPNITQSIYLPDRNAISDSVCEKIRKKHERGRDIQSIKEDLEDDGIQLSENTIESIIANNFLSVFNPALSEEQYRWEEYNFITVQREFREKDFIFQKVQLDFYDIEQISNIYKIDRLKVTSVQTAYTRQKPIDKDAYLEENLDGEIQRKYTSSYGINTHYLPAYESFGEGILIDLNKEILSEWENRQEVTERAGYLKTNFNNSFLGQGQFKEVNPRFILIHTLSHLIIKELEFLCGYPAASLQERLYISGRMQGLLIYTVAGAEGSYGGLISLCKSEKIGMLIRSALHRAMDCASDPICYHTDQQGQGTAGLNLAACYSCALLPETSCEEINSFLDRKLVIDKKIGFFKKVKTAEKVV